MANRDSGEIILALLLGGIVGAAIGMLYAPRSGKELRQKLMDITDDLGDKLEDLKEDVRSKSENLVQEGREKFSSQRERIEAAFEAGKKAYDKKA